VGVGRSGVSTRKAPTMLFFQNVNFVRSPAVIATCCAARGGSLVRHISMVLGVVDASDLLWA
jgi:hypothetical protein